MNILKRARFSCPRIPENVSKKLTREEKITTHMEISSDSQLHSVLWLMMVSGATKELAFGYLLPPCPFQQHILDNHQADLNYRSWSYLSFCPLRRSEVIILSAYPPGCSRSDCLNLVTFKQNQEHKRDIHKVKRIFKAQRTLQAYHFSLILYNQELGFFFLAILSTILPGVTSF